MEFKIKIKKKGIYILLSEKISESLIKAHIFVIKYKLLKKNSLYKIWPSGQEHLCFF